MFNGQVYYIMRLINRLEMLFVILMRHWLRITQRQSEITRNPTLLIDLVSQVGPSKFRSLTQLSLVLLNQKRDLWIPIRGYKLRRLMSLGWLV